jgi:hypothetical protein
MLIRMDSMDNRGGAKSSSICCVHLCIGQMMDLKSGAVRIGENAGLDINVVLLALWGWSWWVERLRLRKAATTHLGWSGRGRATRWMAIYWFIRIKVVAIWMVFVRWYDLEIWTKVSNSDIYLNFTGYDMIQTGTTFSFYNFNGSDVVQDRRAFGPRQHTSWTHR